MEKINTPIDQEPDGEGQHVVVAFSAKGSGGQKFNGSNDPLDAHMGMQICFSRWLSKSHWSA